MLGSFWDGCIEPNGWRYVAAAFSLPWGYFENIFRVAGYLRISLGYIGGGCIDPNAMGGVMWRLHSGCFFRTSWEYQDILGITLGYFVVIMTQSALNPVWRYVAAAFWLHSLTLSHNRSTVVQLRQRDVTRLQVIVISWALLPCLPSLIDDRKICFAL